MCIYVINYNYIDIFIHTGLVQNISIQDIQAICGNSSRRRNNTGALRAPVWTLRAALKSRAPCCQVHLGRWFFLTQGFRAVCPGSHKGSYCQRCSTF